MLALTKSAWTFVVGVAVKRLLTTVPVAVSTAAKFCRGWPFTESNLPPRKRVEPSVDNAKASTSALPVVTETVGVNDERYAPVAMSTAIRLPTGDFTPLGLMALVKAPPTNITSPDLARE